MAPSRGRRVATLFSIAYFTATLHLHGRTTAVPAQLVATGFPGENSQPPVTGLWFARGTVTSSTFGNEPLGTQMARMWRIARTCSAGACSLLLTRQVAGEPPLTAALTRETDGWHATFPDRPYICGQIAGQTVTWQQHSTWILRFLDHGTTAEAHERNVSHAAACGWGTDTLDWTARPSHLP